MTNHHEKVLKRLEDALEQLQALDKPGPWGGGYDQTVRTRAIKIMHGDTRGLLAFDIANVKERIRIIELDIQDYEE
jgi:hypothetical protein